MKHIRSAQNIQRLNYTYNPVIVDSKIDGATAYVDIYTHITYQYYTGAETTEEGTNYTVWFAKIGGTWYIADIYSEENEAFGIADAVEDYNELIADFNVWWREEQVRLAQKETAEVDSSSNAEPTAVTRSVYYDRLYRRDNATAYAYTYTTTSSSTSIQQNFYNPLFPNYADEGGNCQNFVSQCLWAGFGGSNTQAAISGREFPMDTIGAGSYYWATTSSNSSTAWAGTISIKNYLAAVNNGNPTNGLITNFVSTSANSYTGSFEAYTGSTSNLVGSIVYVPGSENEFGHAIIITDATSKSFSDIYYCANSSMAKNKRLSDSYSNTTVCLVVPSVMRDGTPCTASAHNFSNTSGVACNRCRYCGYVNLKVTADMLRPIAQNSTATVSGSASRTCYRIALCITTPSGVSTWLESLNTVSISRSYTFTEKGLYTVQIVCRNLNSSDYPDDSVTAEQTFTIRVY